MLQFLQPCLLLLLQDDAAHGYALLAELERFGFESQRVDPSLVYRALREMEGLGWVESAWDASGSMGPSRRVYSLRPEGRRQLELWVEDLRRTRAEIDRLLHEFHQTNGT